MDIRSRRLVVAIVALVIAVFAVVVLDVPIGTSFTVAGFVAFLATIAVEWLGETAVLPSVTYRVGRLYFVIFLVFLVLHTLWQLYQLPTLSIPFQLYAALGSLTIGFILSVLYAVWKFRDLRYTQAQIGLLKDLVISTHVIMRREADSIDEKKRLATEQICKFVGLIAVSSIWHAAINALLKLVPWRQSGVTTATLYWKADPVNRKFDLASFAWPGGVDARFFQLLNWEAKNHHPVFLDDQGFKDLIRKAKERWPSDWRKHFLESLKRKEVVSICGWVYSKEEEPIKSDDASKCLAWDDSYFYDSGLREKFHKDQWEMLAVRSFVAFPIPKSAVDPGGVLLVVKNVRNGFTPEDVEILILASQLLRRVLET